MLKKIENKYNKIENNNGAKWELEFTTTKIIDNKEANDIIAELARAFEALPPWYTVNVDYKEKEKRVEHTIIGNQVKREVILIKED